MKHPELYLVVRRRSQVELLNPFDEDAKLWEAILIHQDATYTYFGETQNAALSGVVDDFIRNQHLHQYNNQFDFYKEQVVGLCEMAKKTIQRDS